MAVPHLAGRLVPAQEAGHAARELDHAERDRRRSEVTAAQRRNDPHVALGQRLGAVAGALPHGQRGMAGAVVAGDQPLLALMQVDRTLEHGAVGGGRIHLADHAAGRVLHHLHRAPVGRAQVDRVHGPVGTGPEPAGAAAAQVSGCGQPVQQCRQGAAEEPAVGQRHRELLRRGRDVRGEDMRVLRVQDGALHRPVEDQVGVRAQVGVQRVRAGDQHREGIPAGTPGASGLLPETGQGAREAAGDDGVHPGDVDAELEGIRAGDALKLPGLQACLQPAPVIGQVAAAVGSHRTSRQFALGA